MVWVYRTREQPRSVVIYLHGLEGPSEDRPDNHRPQLMHLARQGSAVIYPRYEVGPTTNVMGHILNGVQAGMEHLDVSARADRSDHGPVETELHGRPSVAAPDVRGGKGCVLEAGRQHGRRGALIRPRPGYPLFAVAWWR
jgi:hypothetical protein